MRFWHRLAELGGWRLIRAYHHMGLLSEATRQVVRSVLRGQSPIQGYHRLSRRINPILQQQYAEVPDIDPQPLPPHQPARRRVWQCWLQGMENRPPLVRQCMESQRRCLPDCEFQEITEANYTQWVTLPPHITAKRRQGLIPDALFSDMLRLELLTRYGGLWLDGTVLCTLDKENSHSVIQSEAKNLSSKDVKYHREKLEQILHSDVFVMQYIRDGHPEGLANWMISAEAGNPLLRSTLSRLYAYWHDYDCVVQYYLCHLFLGMSMQEFPDMVARMPRGNAYPCIHLGSILPLPISPQEWAHITHNACFHKLNWRKHTLPKGLL